MAGLIEFLNISTNLGYLIALNGLALLVIALIVVYLIGCTIRGILQDRQDRRLAQELAIDALVRQELEEMNRLLGISAK